MLDFIARLRAAPATTQAADDAKGSTKEGMTRVQNLDYPLG
jgi:hypothetical protein